MEKLQRNLIDQYQEFHASGHYGFGGRHLPVILPHILALKPQSLVDYGAGRSPLAQRLGQKAAIPRVASFDPAVPEISQRPEGMFDLLISMDVLEHIPDEEMDAVFAEMASMATHWLHVIDIKPAKTLLADGRNAHVSLHDADWWQNRMRRFKPEIAPFAINRPNRVALKTWTESLPRWRSAYIERREFWLLSLKKRFDRLTGSPGNRP